MIKKSVLVILLLIIVALAGYVFYKATLSPGNKNQTQKLPQKIEAINGKLVDPNIAQTRPIAVMVENYPDARPQSGLLDADLVYEALAEGGITRFEAIFQTKDSANIGPIRSVREYYAEIANELGASLVHVGGSDAALQKLASGEYANVTDINQFYYGAYFHRISARLAPHNVYTSIETLKKWLADKNANQKANFETWKFKDDANPLPQTPIGSVSINFSTIDYKVTYRYDSTTNTYKRFLAGKSHTDAETKQQFSPKNIIVQFVKTVDIPNDPKLRIDVTLTGQGKAIVFQDGKAIPGTWKKTGNQRTRYYDSSGQEIAFNRGQSWIELVPSDNPDSRVTW
jgi:hypothetical protein